MSDLGNYYGSFETAEELEKNGNKLTAALEYWMCTQYAEHGEFPWVPDLSLESKAWARYRKILNKQPYSPLSKTTFIKGCQCLKALWLYKNKYDKRYVSPEVEQKLHLGHHMGKLAQQLFEHGVDASTFPDLQHRLHILQGKTPLQVPNIPFRLKQNLWLERTQELIDDKTTFIYEAAFSHNSVFSAVDILHHSEDGFIAYEVKNATEIRDVFIHDCALQYYVMSHNIDVKDFFLVYTNENYLQTLDTPIEKLTPENCDLNQLFIRKSVIKEVQTLQETVEKELISIKDVLHQKDEPAVAVGPQCISPYECEFKYYCSKTIRPDYPLDPYF
jgi:hypothetical protein